MTALKESIQHDIIPNVIWLHSKYGDHELELFEVAARTSADKIIKELEDRTLDVLMKTYGEHSDEFKRGCLCTKDLMLKVLRGSENVQ